MYFKSNKRRLLRRIEATLLSMIIAVASISFSSLATENEYKQDEYILEEAESSELQAEEIEPQESGEEQQELIEVEETDLHYVEYSLETSAAGYDISLKAYDGVFPKDEVLSISGY